MYQIKSDAAPVTPPTGPRRGRHLRSGAGALLIVACLAAAARLLLGAWAHQFLEAYAKTGDNEVVKGLSLTLSALDRQDQLVVLGSSELTFQDEYHAARLFAGKPSGFDVHLVGAGYRQSIHNFLTLSGLGPQIAGKRLVLFVSPTWFQGPISDRAYKKNFSRLQAYELAYSARVSPELRRRGAARLLELGEPATHDPLLTGALRALSGGGWADRARYRAAWPLGRLTVEFLRVKDDLDVVWGAYHRKLRPLPNHSRPDWEQLMTQAGADAAANGRSNPFGIYDGYYAKYVAPRLEQIRGSARAETWLDSTEYADLQLVLDLLREQGARPLFISVPVHGSYYDFKGHARADRQEYYRRVRVQIEAAGFPVVDFSDKEYEPGFMRDPWHQGWKGSVTIARTLDDYYHGRLPAPVR